FTTGEGLVNRFTGTGTVYIQTRNIQALANLIEPFIPTKSD
ncbi:MAG TPA: TIGR00266 family protein, partial [Lactobacillus sp.]|nr:TIGR00266 family protein [Lactobacillus sp.]